jgi:hypothetical protein
VPELIAALRREFLSEHLRAGFDLAVKEQLQQYASLAGSKFLAK